MLRLLKASEIDLCHRRYVPTNWRGYRTGIHSLTRVVPSELTVSPSKRSAARDNLPVAFECVYVALGNADAQMVINILQVLQVGAVDVTQQVEVEVVLRVTSAMRATLPAKLKAYWAGKKKSDKK